MQPDGTIFQPSRCKRSRTPQLQLGYIQCLIDAVHPKLAVKQLAPVYCLEQFFAFLLTFT